MTATDEHQITETPELAEFRLKVRSFLAEHAPKRAKRGDDEGAAFEATIADLATQKAFQAALADAGLAGLTWPKPWGQGLTPEHQRVFNEEAAGYELPTTAYIIGLGMVIPTMIEFGTDEQRERYVAKALRGEEIWSQLFSEPGAGSDVASLQMRASATATSGSSTARRSGPPARSCPTSAPSSPARTPTTRSTAASPCSSSTSRHRAWRSGRCAR